ncbi:DUF7146 domain-containing protein [Phenylobacterium montanum]|uniref:Toprim domain-containing protein n=1 Tax=Phenylobacterium montanum TaxID=2823693 RepID=A0A975G4H7_9CAUL|nr:toprim domain-containing protein [Caulobacter sp. S6]QUD90427.1 toprim domain-containing protein [Caulobacter sp. S6]
MIDSAAELSKRLADRAEAVCRCYLSKGRRAGAYWVVGDVANSPGRSLYVRLHKTHDGAPAGKWTDAATGEHGDLLDLIGRRLALASLHEVLAEARRFLGEAEPTPITEASGYASVAKDRSAASRRLFAMAGPIQGTLAADYLRGRGILDLRGCASLRFHPRCWRVAEPGEALPGERRVTPAMIAAVTDLEGQICGVHRTWLDWRTKDKADVPSPRRAMGRLLGNAVRFGLAHEVMAVGEGIETVLSLRQVLPRMPMAAALSANHLALVEWSPGLKRLYIARDADSAGFLATDRLALRAQKAGIGVLVLEPALDDFNADLARHGAKGLHAHLATQIDPADLNRFAAPHLISG